MKLSKKFGYLEGLVTSADLDESKLETKIINALTDLLSEAVDQIEYQNETIMNLLDYMDSTNDILDEYDSEIEALFDLTGNDRLDYMDYLDSEFDDDDDDFRIVHRHSFDDDFEDYDEFDDLDEFDDDFDEFDDFDENPFYSITCDKCGESFMLRENQLLEGTRYCPMCGKPVGIDLRIIDGCDCEECSHDHEHKHDHDDTEK